MLNRTRSGRPYAWNSRLGAGHEENGRLMAVQGRKFINPGGILLPEKAKGDGRGFSNNACPVISWNARPGRVRATAFRLRFFPLARKTARFPLPARATAFRLRFFPLAGKTAKPPLPALDERDRAASGGLLRVPGLPDQVAGLRRRFVFPG